MTNKHNFAIANEEGKNFLLEQKATSFSSLDEKASDLDFIDTFKGPWEIDDAIKAGKLAKSEKSRYDKLEKLYLSISSYKWEAINWNASVDEIQKDRFEVRDLQIAIVTLAFKKGLNANHLFVAEYYSLFADCGSRKQVRQILENLENLSFSRFYQHVLMIRKRIDTAKDGLYDAGHIDAGFGTLINKFSGKPRSFFNNEKEATMWRAYDLGIKQAESDIIAYYHLDALPAWVDVFSEGGAF